MTIFSTPSGPDAVIIITSSRFAITSFPNSLFPSNSTSFRATDFARVSSINLLVYLTLDNRSFFSLSSPCQALPYAVRIEYPHI
jgi:hypothetical protein